MAQYRDYCYADSDKLNFENLKSREEAKARREELGRNEEYEANLKSKLDNGEISEAEYNTLSHTTDFFRRNSRKCGTATIYSRCKSGK